MWLSFADGDGTILDTIRTTVTREVQIEHESEIISAFARSTIDLSLESVYGNGDDGIYRYGGIAATDTLTMRNLQFPYPAQVGQNSTIVRLNFDVEDTQEWEIYDTLHVALVAIDEEIVTPAGTFLTHIYKYYLPPPSDVLYGDFIYSYMAPGVGQVAQIHRREFNGTDKYLYLLGDYCLKTGL